MLTAKNPGAARLHWVLIYCLSGGHEVQQKNIDATGSFTYYAIHDRLVQQLYCIPACTFLRRAELRQTVEYATESTRGQSPVYRGSLAPLSGCYLVQEK